VRLLREHEDVREHYRKRYRHILVDEYQDTNHPQYEIVREIGAEHATCAWWATTTSRSTAGAGPTSQDPGVSHDFAGAKVVRLQTNYRSTRRSSMRPTRHPPQRARHDKALESARGEGEPVRYVRLKDEMLEARYVVSEIRSLLRLEEASQRTSPSCADAGAVPAVRG